MENFQSGYLTLSNDPRIFPIGVVYTDPACDLAILKVAKEYTDVFTTETVPIPLSTVVLPPGSHVQTQGYPVGGNTICTTIGHISRSEDANYASEGPLLLRSQLTAPLNPGSSGGAVFGESANTAYGLSCGTFPGQQNIGFFVPGQVIANFLQNYERIKNSNYIEFLTFPHLSLRYQELTNPALREYCGLDPSGINGIRVASIPGDSIARRILQANDIIIKIDGLLVTSEGKIKYNNELWLNIMSYISMKPFGSRLSLSFLRKNMEKNEYYEINTEIDLTQPYNALYTFDVDPSKHMPYYVHPSGVIFVKPNASFVSSYDRQYTVGQQKVTVSSWRPSSLKNLPPDGKQDIVYLYKVLPSDENIGTTKIEGRVAKANDELVTCLGHLATILENANGDVKITLTCGQIIVLPKKNEEENKAFLTKNSIVRHMSPGVENYFNLPDTAEKRQAYFAAVHNELKKGKNLKAVTTTHYRDAPNLSLFNDQHHKDEVAASRMTNTA